MPTSNELAEVAPEQTLVASVMTRDVVTLDRNQTLDQVEECASSRRIRHFPVVSAGRVVGIVSERDLFQSALAQALGYGTKARRTLMHTLRVKEIMSEPPVTIAPTATSREAARLMLERRIGCLPVVERGLLVGLVTKGDLLRRMTCPG